MKKQQFVTAFGVVLALILSSGVSAQEEFLMQSLGGVEVWSIPQEAPADGVLATILELRTVDPDSSLVTFTNLAITGGKTHQTWLGGPFGGPTPSVDTVAAGQAFGEGWDKFDTHLLITPPMVGGGAGGGFPGITETNDGSTTDAIGATLPQLAGGFGASTGFGDLAMGAATDAFFLTPENQSNTLPFAYVVTDGVAAGEGEVFLTLGVLGAGIVDAGVDGGAAFGYLGNDPMAIPFAVPEPSAVALAGLACLGLLGLRRRNG